MEQARTTNRLVGSPIERIEDLRFLRGRGEYVGDLAVDGMLHAAVLRSSFAHGRIRAIDASAARARTGVRAVITASDIGAVPFIPQRLDVLPGFKRYEQPVIAHQKVRYVGEPLAVVVADSAALAEDALEAIAVDIEPLRAVADRTTARANEVLLFDHESNVAGTLTAL
jgi:carbon-monoxide dehydrogenase large subunit